MNGDFSNTVNWTHPSEQHTVNSSEMLHVESQTELYITETAIHMHEFNGTTFSLYFISG